MPNQLCFALCIINPWNYISVMAISCLYVFPIYILRIPCNVYNTYIIVFMPNGEIIFKKPYTT